MKTRLRKMIQKRLFTFLLCFSLISSTTAQHLMLGGENAEVEIGLNFGPTFFLGDLGGKVGKGTTFIKDLNYQLTKLMKGAFISIYPNEWLGFRLAGQYTMWKVSTVLSVHMVWMNCGANNVTWILKAICGKYMALWNFFLCNI